MKNSNSESDQNIMISKVIKAKSDSISGLRELFVDELKDVYWAEKELTKTIPKMLKNVTSEQLRDALTSHLDDTRKQVTRLEEIFLFIDEKSVAKKCEAMAGLTKEAEGIIKETEKGIVRDVAIIAAAQKIEHYEIATYGTLASFARLLGEDEAASLLEITLSEEKAADIRLSEIANLINEEALDDEDWRMLQNRELV